MLTFIRTFMASFRKQFKEFTRYPNFILKSFFYTPISIVLPYFYMMKTFVANDSSKSNTTIFLLLLGVVLWNFIYFSVIETCNIVSRELNIGTVEVIYTTPSSKIAWLLGSSFAPSLMFFCSLSFIVFLTYVLIRPTIVVNFALICTTLILTILSTWAVCILTFLLNLWLKKIFNILNFSLDIIAIFVGQLYVISKFPLSIRIVSYLLPTTYSISLIRQGFSTNMISGNTQKEMVALIITTLIITTGSITCYNILERRLKNNGSFLKF